MTPMTAWILLFNGLGLLGLDVEGPRHTRPAQILALLAGACSLLGMFGYIYGTFTFLGYTLAFVAMSLPTALVSSLLCAGLLCARPGCGPMKILTSDNLGGTLARRLLLAAIMIPVALDVMTITAERRGLFGQHAHAVIDAIANVSIFAGLIFFTARLIDRVDAERRRREAELRVSEERFRVVTETAVNAIITADQHGNIGLWNKAAETIFGYAPSEILGRPVATLMPERFQAAHKMGMEQAVSAGESKLAGQTVELTGRRKDGSEFPVELSLATWKKDEAILFTGIIRDITRRKTAEAERDRTIVELQKTLAEVKTLKGFIPICASCKKIRDDKGFWSQIESYISRHSDAKFSHGICPDCSKKLYPEFADEPGPSQSPAPGPQSVRPVAPTMPTATTGGGQAILLVEPDHAARGSTWQVLKGGGFTVVAVS
jgi:PAS domain S-box-containing protein